MAMSAFWLTNLRKLIPTVAAQPKPVTEKFQSMMMSNILQVASETLAPKPVVAPVVVQLTAKPVDASVSAILEKLAREADLAKTAPATAQVSEGLSTEQLAKMAAAEIECQKLLASYVQKSGLPSGNIISEMNREPNGRFAPLKKYFERLGAFRKEMALQSEANVASAPAVAQIAVEKAAEITVPIVLTNAIKSFSKSFKFPYDEAKAAKIAVQLSRDNQREYITEADGRSKIVDKSDFAVSQYVKEMAKEKGMENIVSSLPDAYKAPVRRMVGARAGEIDAMDSLEAAFVAAKGDFPSPDLLEGLNII